MFPVAISNTLAVMPCDCICDISMSPRHLYMVLMRLCQELLGEIRLSVTRRPRAQKRGGSLVTLTFGLRIFLAGNVCDTVLLLVCNHLVQVEEDPTKDLSAED